MYMQCHVSFSLIKVRGECFDKVGVTDINDKLYAHAQNSQLQIHVYVDLSGLYKGTKFEGCTLHKQYKQCDYLTESINQ